MDNGADSNNLMDRSAARRFGDNKPKLITTVILQRGGGLFILAGSDTHSHGCSTGNQISSCPLRP
jgi:hypothetical protein